MWPQSISGSARRCIVGSAMRAGSQAVHLTATPATEIARTEIQEETDECHYGKDKIEDDACPIKRRHGEERVQAHAHAQECEHIEKSLSERQLAEHLVDCCQEKDEQKPEEKNKDAEHQGQ